MTVQFPQRESQAHSAQTSFSDDERDELLAGLRQTPPRLAPRYFYDDAGSNLFSEITKTREYYPTRTELSILTERGQEIAAHVAPHAVVVELGSGSGDKVITLLGQLDRPRAYRPIDISRVALDATQSAVEAAYPALDILPFLGDFTDPEAYRGLPVGSPVLVYYSGSTIGNYEPREAVAFLQKLRAVLSGGGKVLLGVDLTKDKSILDAAYNDSRGITAAFNRNMLRHINARFGADFDPEAFDHVASYNANRRRIEMHLAARAPQVVHIADERIVFEPENPIHTENSYKFDLDDVQRLAEASGFCVEAIVTDSRRWFAEAILVAP